MEADQAVQAKQAAGASLAEQVHWVSYSVVQPAPVHKAVCA